MTERTQLFITATDTGVGKTLICGLLLGYLRQQGILAGYQKWAATGVEDSVADLERVRQLAGPDGAPSDPMAQQVPYRFPFPASPHLAAELAGQRIEPELIIKAYESMRKRYDVLLVEGVGGIMVPLSRDLMLADLVARLRLSTLLVARSGLGTLNHTLLTLEALRHRKIPLLGVLFTDGPGEDETIAADNLRTIAELGRARVFGRLPWCGSDREFTAAFQALGAEISAALCG